MEKTKPGITISEKHNKLRAESDAALKKVSKKLIEETKKENGYIVVTDKTGLIKKIPAKDL